VDKRRKSNAVSTKYTKIFEPGYIGSVKTKNRMLRMGASPGFAAYEDGYVPAVLLRFYEAIARGGIGLITIGIAPVGAPPGKGFSLAEDKYIPRMKELNDLIHKYDCPHLSRCFISVPGSRRR